MIRSTIFAFAAIAIFVAGAALYAGLAPTAASGSNHNYGLRSHSHPHYVNGSIIKGCEYLPECDGLVRW
jgi:hypothetical protein